MFVVLTLLTCLVVGILIDCCLYLIVLGLFNLNLVYVFIVFVVLDFAWVTNWFMLFFVVFSL